MKDREDTSGSKDGTYYGSTTTGNTPKTFTPTPDLTVKPKNPVDKWTPGPTQPTPTTAPATTRPSPQLTLPTNQEPDLDTPLGQVPSYLIGPADMRPAYMEQVPTNLTSYPTTWRPSPWGTPSGWNRNPMADYYANKATAATGDAPRPGAQPPLPQQPYGQTYSQLNAEQGAIVSWDDPKRDDKLRVLVGIEAFAGSTGSVDYDTTMSVDEATEYTMLPTEMQDEVARLTRRYYSGMYPQMAWIEKRWAKAVQIAAQRYSLKGEKVTPFQVYDQMIAAWKASGKGPGGSSGGGGGYGGGGYGGGGGTSQIVLTSATDARIILNQAMSNFLGRQATQEEINKFVDLLNQQERANPVTSTVEGNAVVQSGGFNPNTFAEDYARGMDGSAEYMAATSFMDALMQAMSQDTGVI